MSSMVYPNDGEDPSAVPVGTIIPHPYLNSNPNVAYAAAAAAAAAAASSGSPSSVAAVGQYSHYYGHSQPLFNVPQTSGFYPPTMNPSHGHPTDFNTSSPSVASSSSSIDSARKATNRKRNATGAKSTNKRKLNNDDDLDAAAAGAGAGLDDDDNDDDEENKCYLRGAASMGNMMMSNNHPHAPSGVAGEEDKEKQARENHCEIERRRRVKMATYFAELCDMVPSCANLARKPDKLTILRMAAQFMKTLRTNNNSLGLNSSSSLSSGQDLHKPSFLNDQELKYLMVESCDAFLFALNCDNLRVIYISDAIQQILSYTCQDWYSRFFYDFVHPDDVEKVREQLNLQSPDGSPNGVCNARVLDLKTGTVKKDGHSTGARLVSSKRSFICRLRVGTANGLDGNHSNPFVNPSILRRRHRTALGPSIDGHLYEVVHISGYIRNLNNHPTSNHDNLNLHHHHHPTSSNSNSQMAFIAIARIQNSSSPNVNDLTNGSVSSLNAFTTEFTCRCQPETGEILFIDQRCTPIIGYKSHELLHKILFEQIHPDDQLKFQELFKRTVTQKNLVNPSPNLNHLMLRFRSNLENDYVSLKCSTYAFCNPCTDEIEFLIVTFLSSQPTSTATPTTTVTTNNKTSVIASTNDYHSQTYENYARTSNASAMSTRYPGNADEQTYASNNVETNDGRTYVSNNGGSTWATANENWETRNTTNYLDPQSQLTIYHQYH